MRVSDSECRRARVRMRRRRVALRGAAGALGSALRIGLTHAYTSFNTLEPFFTIAGLRVRAHNRWGAGAGSGADGGHGGLPLRRDVDWLRRDAGRRG